MIEDPATGSAAGRLVRISSNGLVHRNDAGHGQSARCRDGPAEPPAHASPKTARSRAQVGGKSVRVGRARSICRTRHREPDNAGPRWSVGRIGVPEPVDCRRSSRIFPALGLAGSDSASTRKVVLLCGRHQPGDQAVLRGATGSTWPRTTSSRKSISAAYRLSIHRTHSRTRAVDVAAPMSAILASQREPNEVWAILRSTPIAVSNRPGSCATVRKRVRFRTGAAAAFMDGSAIQG